MADEHHMITGWVGHGTFQVSLVPQLRAILMKGILFFWVLGLGLQVLSSKLAST